MTTGEFITLVLVALVASLLIRLWIQNFPTIALEVGLPPNVQ